MMFDKLEIYISEYQILTLIQITENNNQNTNHIFKPDYFDRILNRTVLGADYILITYLLL